MGNSRVEALKYIQYDLLDMIRKTKFKREEKKLMQLYNRYFQSNKSQVKRNITRKQSADRKREGGDIELIDPSKLFLMFPDDMSCHPHHKFPEVGGLYGNTQLYVDPKTWTAFYNNDVDQRSDDYIFNHHRERRRK